jgi:hypothetical protein
MQIINRRNRNEKMFSDEKIDRRMENAAKANRVETHRRLALEKRDLS